MRKGVLLFVIIGAIICVLLILSKQRPKPPPLTVEPAVELHTSNPTVTTLPNSIHPSVIQSGGANIQSRNSQEPIYKNQTIQEILLEENSKSQDFYGRVADQYGQSINDADASGTLIIKTEEGFETKKVATKTDVDGLFQFVGLLGADLNVKVKKDGYKMEDRGEGYQNPVGGKSSPNSRATFTMWKLHGAEPLTGSSIHSKIPHDGSSTIFDTATGKISPDGDFRVTLSQFPLDVNTGRERFDWKVNIEILNGGLLEENDPYPYWAPADGYQPSFEFNVSSNASDWLPNLKKQFYIKNAHGQYGLMQFSVYPGRSPTELDANFTTNPSGSQNLEPSFSN